MKSGQPAVEIYFYDAIHPIEKKCEFKISDNEHRSIIVIYAGIQVKQTITVRVDGNCCNANLVVMPLLWQEQSLDLVVNQYHAASNSTSKVQIIGAVSGSAQLRVTVASKCDEQAHNVSVEQQSNVLLLSHEARAVTMPCIQSISMNVQCKHGASLHTFDDDQVSYMKSRGIYDPKIRELLCESFLLLHIDYAVSEQCRELLTTYFRRAIDQLLEHSVALQ